MGGGGIKSAALTFELNAAIFPWQAVRPKLCYLNHFYTVSVNFTKLAVAPSRLNRRQSDQAEV